MLRLVGTLFLFMIAWMFSPDGGGSGGDGSGSGDQGGGSGSNQGGSQGGQSGSTQGQGSSQQSSTQGTGDSSTGRTFSQDDVNSAAGRARGEGREAAERQIAQDLGVSLDEAKTIIQGHQEAQRQNQTELERLQGDHQKATSERDSAQEQVFELESDIAIRDELDALDVKPTRAKAALRQVDKEALDVDESGNLKGVKEAVAKVKEDLPEFFNEPADDDQSNGQGSEAGQQRTAADASGQQTGGGRPRNLQEALQAHYQG